MLYEGITKEKEEEIYLRVVKKDGRNIRYIKKPSLKVILCAIEQNHLVIRYLKNPPKEALMMAFKMIKKETSLSLS